MCKSLVIRELLAVEDEHLAGGGNTLLALDLGLELLDGGGGLDPVLEAEGGTVRVVDVFDLDGEVVVEAGEEDGEERRSVAEHFEVDVDVDGSRDLFEFRFVI